MSSQSPESVHSNAFNFSEFVSGGVDPRTGIYTCSLSLGVIRSADLNGPSFNLALNFNPLNLRNTGYGLGWSLTLTRYDVRDKVMALFTGETYRAVESRNALHFKEMKLESAKVLKHGDGHYEVRYKDGRREELKVFGATQIAVPIRIFAANGVSISLKYALFNEQPMLIEIADDKRTLLKVGSTRGRVTLTRDPDTPASAGFTLKLKNDRVSTIGLPVGRGWDLQYEDINGTGYLKRVVSPLGAVENIRYKEVGHLLPTLQGVQSLPYVIAHDIYPKQGQPKVVKAYTYSDWNFLGHGVAADPSDDGDPLYRATSVYRYSSVERLMMGEKVHTQVKRTYNKFHLLVSEVTTCGDAVVTVATEYHGDEKKTLAQQPAQFRMPKTHTRSYEDLLTKKIRSETSTTEFDVAGNPRKQVGIDGVTTLFEYFPSFESPDCPADPIGFVRFLKQQTVIPASGGGASTVKRFRYALQPGVEGSTLANVVPVEEQLFECVADREVLLSTASLAYVNTPGDSFQHGVLQQRSVSRDSKTSGVEYSYVLDDNTLVLKKIVQGFDGTSATTEQTLSTLNALTLSERDADGQVVEYEYDKIGRQLRKTMSPGTTNASSIHWVYHAASANEPAMVVMTDSSGGTQVVSYDALGRVIGIQEKDCDNPDQSGESPMRTVFAAVHDQVGRLVEQTHSDWWEGVARPVKTRSLYDDWGNVRETRHGDGRIEHIEFDPVGRQQKTWQHGLGQTVTIINDFGKPDSIEVFDLKGQSLGKTVFEYDGLGRTLSQTDPAGNKTRYEYDVFSRMVRSVLPDGHAVETTFAAHSSDELPVEIKVAGVQLGQQTFDGLNRITGITVGRRKLIASYEAGRSLPESHTDAAGRKTEFVYAQGLGCLLAERKAVVEGETDGLITRYTYDPLNGQPKSCTEQDRESHFEYFPSGRLKSETSRYGEQSRTASHTYSLAGLPLTYVDVLGVKHTIEYDKWGRKISFRQGAVQADFFYEKRSLLQKIETRDTASKRLMTTRLTYDDIGRESTRSFEVNGLPTQTLTSSYTLGSKLAQKVLRRGAIVLRDERFTYDVRGRLTQYDCDGSQRPRDAYGKQIVQQKFTFDALDNIVALQTTFAQGVNVTTFSFSENDPAQLVGVTHSHADYPAPVTLEYDADGRMIKDDQARTLAYDAFGRLIQVSNARGEVLRGYHYDGFDRIVELSQPHMKNVQRYYHNASVSNEIRGSDSRSVVRNGGLLLGQQQRGIDAGSQIFGADQQQSVLTQLHGEQWGDSAYSPYGHRPAEGGLFSLAGFNGEQLDGVTGLYLLGNGYRAYSPTLMRFNSPDTLSPFDAGGLNAYAYCLGDPVNRVDPTGHVAWQSIAGIALGFIGIVASIVTFGAATPLASLALGLGIASGAAAIGSELANELDPESGVGNILGYISLGFGLASLGAGLGALAVKGGNRLAGAFRHGLAGKRPKSSPITAIEPGASNETRWTYKTMNFRGKVDGQKTGEGAIKGFEKLFPSEKQKFFQFKDLVKEQGKSHLEAFEIMKIDARLKEILPFEYASAHQLADPGFFNQTGQFEARISGGTRMFFFADRQRHTVTMQAFSHTMKGA
ncbi:RHS repeat-associated protein [Pseudomonas helmanticensis]|uniref:RHS repeat-associated protein n=1 Tax=Pseudomonas helmanticensis TaxID=1471381 RepID=A0A4R7VGT7_9PSED|nr:RHS repeat-associated core domain-containing protein [Pseudomonas helmanticensis]TDV48522.1 RHS repeat-associated protein [Pseudomonas helmanticensis]